MLRAVAGNHALAQQHFCALHRALLGEIFVLYYEHFAEVVGVVQEDDVVPSNLVMRDVAVFLGQVLKEQDRIRGAESAERKPQEISLEAGRKAVLDRAPHVVPRNIVSGGSCHRSSVLREGIGEEQTRTLLRWTAEAAVPT